MNLADFLIANPSCKSLTCGTCGGMLMFDANVRSFLESGHDLLTELRAVPEADALHRTVPGHLIRDLIARLDTEDERRALVADWVVKVRKSPDVAALLLDWLSPGTECFRELGDSILESLAPRAVADRDLRDVLRERFAGNYWTIPALEHACAADDEARRQLWHAAETKRRERQRAKDDLRCEMESLSGAARLRRLVEQPVLRPKTLPAEWAVVTSEELADLTHSDVEALIQYVGWSASYPWATMLQHLFHARHEKRKAEIDRIRLLVAGKPISKSLEMLLGDSERPIELFPPELADVVTAEVLVQLTEESRARFGLLLRRTRLRCWRQMATRLQVP